MEHVAALMLLVGCNTDASICTELPASMVTYEDVADCESDMSLQMRLSGSAAAKVYGACKAVTEDVFEQSATVDWTISQGGKLLVTFDAEPQLVATR